MSAAKLEKKSLVSCQWSVVSCQLLSLNAVNSQQSTVNNSHSQFPMPHNSQSCLWKNLWKSCPQFVENFTRSPETVFVPKWAGDRPHQLFHKFSTGIYYL
ncbi:hypothetical protein [Microcoleus sp. S13C4]|uniref:hypothetical protein n=1 Tax=Microcoleus sp. S13C4 TaxID=3055410 RepID=UPI002FD50678